ncbi:ankyrin-3 [Caerostris darwini]|uniref:Alpha-latrotoxin n=1 Tax=Caerostris darwini TaxID=1538125 RepID=A0AAV4VWF3_9ARAC|nr:ankyrin-3 [Caerostris darwini]
MQSDISKLTVTITDVLNNLKSKAINNLKNKVKSFKQNKNAKDFFRPFKSAILLEKKAENISYSTLIKGVVEQFEELMSDLQIFVKDKIERSLFEEINYMIYKEKTKLKTNKDNVENNVKKLGLVFRLSEVSEDFDMRTSQNCLNRFEESVGLETSFMNLIQSKLRQLLESIISRKEKNNSGKQFALFRILHLLDYHVSDVKWIKEFQNILCQVNSKNVNCKKPKTNLAGHLLEPKLKFLKKLLIDIDLNSHEFYSENSFEDNTESFVVVEMLLLDILSISEAQLTRNTFYLDSDYSLHIGKNLRNQLAHENALVNILSDVPMQVLLNAEKIISKNCINRVRKIDKIIKCNSSKLKQTHFEELSIVMNQQKLFIALEDGNMQQVEDCIRAGADILGRDLHNACCLHFSAKAPSAKAIEFILEQGLSVNSKDNDGQIALHVAARFNRLKTVKHLVEVKHVSLNDRDVNGKTPLFIAVENDCREVVEYLLQHGANALIKNAIGVLPLHTAIRLNFVDVVKILLEKETNVDANLSSCGCTSLHFAAEVEDLALVNILIEKKADVNFKTEFGDTPLILAVQKGHLEVVKNLILKKADINAKNLCGDTPLHKASWKGHEEVVKLLLDHEASLSAFDDDCVFPLHCSAQEGHLKVTKLLLDKNADVTVQTNFGLTPLHFAAQNGHHDVVSLLLEHKALVDCYGNFKITALHYSAERGHKNIVKILIEKGADIDKKEDAGSTPLHLAAGRGHGDVVQLLISKGADVHAEDSSKSTALHFAASICHKDIVKLLLLKGADILKVVRFNITPIRVMISNGLSDILINEKVNINFTDPTGLTALHLGALYGDLPFAEYCIKKTDNNINVKNNEGLTPLHLASRGNFQHVVSFLIDKGAEINAKDNNGRTAFYFACINNYKDVMHILINKETKDKLDYKEKIQLLIIAVTWGYNDTVNILFQNTKFDIGELQKEYHLLHEAVRAGHRVIVENLLKRGFQVDAERDSYTPLHTSVQFNHLSIAQFLLSKDANQKVKDREGRTPLHLAVVYNSIEMVETLLNAEADAFTKEKNKKSTTERRSANHRFDAIRMLIQEKESDVSFKINGDITLLHLSADVGSLEMTEYFFDNGFDIHAKDSTGCKPVHVAAQRGFNDIVEFYLDRGIHASDLGWDHLTLLHLSARTGKSNVCELLIGRSADVNAVSVDGSTPIHLAAGNGFKDVVGMLLHNGAYYNAHDGSKLAPLHRSKENSISTLLRIVEELFRAVVKNDSFRLENEFKEGFNYSTYCFANAKCLKNETLLHFVAKKGCGEIVDILLKHGANTNARDTNKYTPLHYAAKSSHLNVVKSLLMNGTVYNALSHNQEIPLDIAVGKEVINLLRFVSESFKKVQINNYSVLSDLKKDIDLAKLTLRAKNRKCRTLIEVAILCDFPKTDLLKSLFQDNILFEMTETLFEEQKFEECFRAFEKVLHERIEMFGSDNPSVLDIQTHMAQILCVQRKYDEASCVFQEICQKRQIAFSDNHKEVLFIKFHIASISSEQGNNQEALQMLRQVLFKQETILEPNDEHILLTQTQIANVLVREKKYNESLKMYFDILERKRNIYGAHDSSTLNIQIRIAESLREQGNFSDAIKYFKKVYKMRNKVLGPEDPDTLQIKADIASTRYDQHNSFEFYDAIERVLHKQKRSLNPNHEYILLNEYRLAYILYREKRFVSALKYFLTLEKKTAFLGSKHYLFKKCRERIDDISSFFKASGVERSFEKLKSDLGQPSENEENNFEDLSNNVEMDESNPLQKVVAEDETENLKILLERAWMSSKFSRVEIRPFMWLLPEDRVPPSTSYCVTAKTAIVVFCRIHGALYDVKNKANRTPLDLCQDEEIRSLLQAVEDLFSCVQKGKCDDVVGKLEALDSEDAEAATGARNSSGKTLLLVALQTNQKGLAEELGKWLKRQNW